MKEKLQEEAKVKYGLTAEQMKDAEDQLEEFMALSTARGVISTMSEGDAKLLTLDATSLPKEEKIALLCTLYAKLRALKQVTSKGGGVLYLFRENDDQENYGTNAKGNGGRDAIKIAFYSGGKPIVKSRGLKRSADRTSKVKAQAKPEGQAQPRRHKKVHVSRRIHRESDSEEDMVPNTNAVDVVFDLDLANLVAMGFDEQQARDALEETSGDIEAAAEWLMQHCI